MERHRELYVKKLDCLDFNDYVGNSLMMCRKSSAPTPFSSFLYIYIGEVKHFSTNVNDLYLDGFSLVRNFGENHALANNFVFGKLYNGKRPFCEQPLNNSLYLDRFDFYKFNKKLNLVDVVNDITNGKLFVVKEDKFDISIF